MHACRTRPPWLPTAHLQLGDVKLRESDGIRLLHRNANADSGAAPQYAVDMRQGAGSSREWGRCVSVYAEILQCTSPYSTLARSDSAALKESFHLENSYYACVYLHAHELLFLLRLPCCCAGLPTCCFGRLLGQCTPQLCRTRYGAVGPATSPRI